MNEQQAKQAHGTALIKMLEGVAEYVAAYQSLYGQDVGQDYVIGDAVEAILGEISGKLLCGELGAQDGAELSRSICGVATKAGFKNF